MSYFRRQTAAALELGAINAINGNILMIMYYSQHGWAWSRQLGGGLFCNFCFATQILGFGSLLGAGLSLFLPETAGRELPDTVEEAR